MLFFQKKKEKKDSRNTILHLCTKNLRYKAQWTEFFVILGHFLPFYPTNNPDNQNFEKMKITPGDITILHMFTINDNHIMYGSWDMEYNRQNFLSLVHFFLLPN